MDSFFRIIPAALLSLLFAFSVPVYAQEQQPPPVAGEDIHKPSMTDEEVTIMRDDYAGKYNISTLENLSKLYWRLGAFDFEDEEAIGNYIKINDCKIYTEYVNDDLEWREILATMKKHLKTHYDTFPLNFQFVLELHLGRYDPEKGGFPLVDKTGFKDAKRIGVDSIDNNLDICYSSDPIKDYPKGLIVILDKPFTLDFLKVDEHVAQAYILRKKSEYSNMSEDKRITYYERPAYLRLRMTFSQYHGNMNGESAQVTALIYGHINGYEIFEDSDQKRLMLSVNEEGEGVVQPATEEMGEDAGQSQKEDEDSNEGSGQVTKMPQPGESSTSP